MAPKGGSAYLSHSTTEVRKTLKPSSSLCHPINSLSPNGSPRYYLFYMFSDQLGYAQGSFFLESCPRGGRFLTMKRVALIWWHQPCSLYPWVQDTVVMPLRGWIHGTLKSQSVPSSFRRIQHLVVELYYCEGQCRRTGEHWNLSWFIFLPHLEICPCHSHNSVPVLNATYDSDRRHGKG